MTLASLGKAGLVTPKCEGDGGTPRGRVKPLAALSRTLRDAGHVRALAVPCRRTRADDGWCDEPQSQRYNRFVRLPQLSSHEVLRRPDALYDVIVVTDQNQRPRVRGRGSALFIHVARAGLTPTAGCLAFPAAVWRRGTVPRGSFLIGVDPRPSR